MGPPKRIRRKYETPIHPWIKSRIDDEKRLSRTYGTKNKKELWKMDTVLKKFKNQAKYLIAATGDQVELEKQHLFRRVKQLGIVKGDVGFDEILGSTLDDVMERRLQTIVYKKGLAHSVSQARQFITHEHILVNGRTITSPAYMVTVSEESAVEFSPSSPLYSEQHPERAKPEDKKNTKAKAPKMDGEADENTGEASGKDADTAKQPSEEKSSDETVKQEVTEEKNDEKSEQPLPTEETGENK